MSANDKTEATFHGQLPGVRYGVESAKLTQDEDERKRLQEARLAEMAEADAEWPEPEESDWPIEPGEVVQIPDNGIAGIPDNLMRNAGLEILIQQSGQNSKDHGFHEDFPDVDGDPKELGLALTQKLMLMVEELVESFGEIRDGRSPYQTYYVDKKGLIGPKGAEYDEQVYGKLGVLGWGKEQKPGEIPLLKPEGFLVEIADLFIRGADLIFLLKAPEEFIHALEKKHGYNVTREFKHGRQF